MIEIKTPEPLVLATPVIPPSPVRLLATTYAKGGRIALLLVSADLGEPFMTITCNRPEGTLEDNEVFVKTWSENEGIDKWLTKNHIAFDTGRRYITGFTHASVFRIQPWVFDQIKKESI